MRLAADAIGFFTIRGIAGEPLKVVLLYDRVAPEITTAAIALERLAFAVIGTIIAALISLVVVTRLSMPGAWDTIFTMLILGAVMLLGVVGVMARRRSGDYLGRLVTAIDRATGRRLEDLACHPVHPRSRGRAAAAAARRPASAGRADRAGGGLLRR